MIDGLPVDGARKGVERAGGLREPAATPFRASGAWRFAPSGPFGALLCLAPLDEHPPRLRTPPPALKGASRRFALAFGHP